MISVEEQRPGGPIPVPDLPDDLTVSQFMLDAHHSHRSPTSFDVPWFIDDETGRKVGLEEIRVWTAGLANAFKTRFGIKENDVVAIYSTNRMNFPIVLWAVHKLGAILSCSNPTSSAEEFTSQCEMTKPTLIVASQEQISSAVKAGAIAGVPAERIVPIDKTDSDLPGVSRVTVTDLMAEGMKVNQAFVERRLAPGEGKTKIALYCFSSGTTGKPKAVMLSHYALIADALLTVAGTKANDDSIEWNKRAYRSGSVSLGVLPFYHIYGLITFLLFVPLIGSTVVVVPRFSFLNMLKSIERYKITMLAIVPPMALLLIKSPETRKYDLSSVRTIICGAAPFSAELMERLALVIPEAWIAQGFGMTETCGAVSWMNVDEKLAAPGCSGTLFPGIEARVIRQDGSEADYNEPGQLLIRTPTMANGYLNNENANKETFIDGWVYSGDEVVVNEKRQMFVKDRLKEFLKVKGFQVAPAELEAHLHSHPDVADVAVVGIADEYSGELPLAFVVLSPVAQNRLKSKATTLEEMRTVLMKYVSDHSASYKQLASVEFTDDIPKNPSGKLLRRVLRERAKQLRAAGRLTLPRRSKM